MVKPVAFHFGLLPRAGADDRSPVVVNLQHEPRRLLFWVAKHAAEHEDDVGHEVDGIVPNDDLPNGDHAGRFLHRCCGLLRHYADTVPAFEFHENAECAKSFGRYPFQIAIVNVIL